MNLRLQSLFICLFFFFTSSAMFAQTVVVVNSIADLKTEFNGATNDKIIQLSASFPTTLTEEVELFPPAGINLTITGVDPSNPKVIRPLENMYHFIIRETTSGATAGTISFHHLILEGLRTASDISTDAVTTSGGGIQFHMKGFYDFNHLIFRNIGNKTAIAAGVKTGASNVDNIDLQIKNTTFKDNLKINMWGGFLDCCGNLTIDSCTFNKNQTFSNLGIKGGAMYIQGAANKKAVIKNSAFLYNRSAQNGGAVYFMYSAQTFSGEVNNCYFEGNKSLPTKNGSSVTNNSDGGAVAIYENQGTFKVLNSTFYKNHAEDDGGALFIQRGSPNPGTYLTANCTFFENSSRDYSPTCTSGGAVQLALLVEATFENNTFVRNYTQSIRKRAAAIGFHVDNANKANAPTINLRNNLFMGNYTTYAYSKPSATDSTYFNVADTSVSTYGRAKVIDLGGNVGLDNGTKLADNITLNNAFGIEQDTARLQLVDMTGGKNNVGNPNETLYPITALPIRPEGIADDVISTAITSGLENDQNGNPRHAGKSDVGAVEIKWAKFIANADDKANWPELASLNLLDGKIFYEGSAPDSLYLIYPYNSSQGIAYTAPTHSEGETFKIWSVLPDGGGATKNVGDVLPVFSDNQVWYAQWGKGGTNPPTNPTVYLKVTLDDFYFNCYTTDPVAGDYYVKEGECFTFKFIYDICCIPPYEFKPIVIANKDTLTADADGNYTICNIHEAIHIQIIPNDPPPVANESLTDSGNLWTSVGQLHILSDKRQTVTIYDMVGRQVKQETISAGETVIPLSKGIYVVKLADGSSGKALIQ